MEMSTPNDSDEDVAFTELATNPPMVPSFFLEPPLLQDSLESESQKVQIETVQLCLPFLRGFLDARRRFDFDENGIPFLGRSDHVSFVRRGLGRYPAAFVALDAARPWFVYWSLTSLYLLGEDVSIYRARVIKTTYTQQSSTGGFSGGYGQCAHLAPTYAVLLSLAMVGGEDAYSLVNRSALWHWLGRLKQANGSFQVSEGGEEDVRGAYCALVAMSLLNIPDVLPPEAPARAAGLEKLTDGLGEWVSRCQTYEGGIGGSPGNEAHGAYVFCALACLCLLDYPDRAMDKFVDTEALVRWLSSRQYAPEGGLAGRTNKLVDGCYSHWIGGSWPLLQAAMKGSQDPQGSSVSKQTKDLYSTEGLARYILSCCQADSGGLRDKPSKPPDAYHTCYNLAGLSTVQHSHRFRAPAHELQTVGGARWSTSRKTPSEGFSTISGLSQGAEVPALHPVYVVPHRAVEAMRKWSATCSHDL